jgi:hypothetical protein
MSVPNLEYYTVVVFYSFTFGHVLGLENLHVPIVHILHVLGNVLGLDEWHLGQSAIRPIIFRGQLFFSCSVG